MEALAIIVGFAAVVIAPFVIHFLNQKRDETKRRIDSEDKKIEEAQKYLDAFSDISLKLTHYHNHIILSQNTERYSKELEKINELMATTATKVTSIALLGDKELIELDDALVSVIKSELQLIVGIQAKINSGENFDKEIMLAIVPEFSTGKSQVLGKMYSRLNTISQNIK